MSDVDVQQVSETADAQQVSEADVLDELESMEAAIAEALARKDQPSPEFKRVPLTDPGSNLVRRC